ncbi:ankyrin repeat-containing domain protein [Lophiotrema nucula]|uniref:Ankyrin repeat-containing domain protein n=1 Tax=Lophiotrema nucula TaxID=690887 RepID=A0A6A5YET1_9PLEO|nr:ankyrin repeat-containing domain protein [Lophiotrema nucula]
MESQLKTELGEDLWRACTEGHLEDMEFIISQHKSTDSSYKPPLSSVMKAATLRDKANIVSYCLKQGAIVTEPLMNSLVSAGSFQTHKVLVESGAVDIDYYIPWFGTVLAVAAPAGNYEWTEYCLEKGANANFDRVDEYKTVLAATAENGRIDVVGLLLDHGATLNSSGAIVLAAETGEKEVVSLLLDRGADIHEIGVADPTDPRVTEYMGSALHKAVEGGHKDVVELLLERGADVNLQDVKGRTPLDLAKEVKMPDMVGLLENHSVR